MQQKTALQIFTEDTSRQIDNLSLSFDIMTLKQLKQYELGLAQFFPELIAVREVVKAETERKLRIKQKPTTA